MGDRAIYYGCHRLDYTGNNAWESSDGFTASEQGDGYLAIYDPTTTSKRWVYADLTNNYSSIFIERSSGKVHFIDEDGTDDEGQSLDCYFRMFPCEKFTHEGSLETDVHSLRESPIILSLNERINIAIDAMTAVGMQGSILFLSPSPATQSIYEIFVEPMYFYLERRLNKKGTTDSSITLMTGFMENTLSEFGGVLIGGVGVQSHLATGLLNDKNRFPFFSATLLGEYGTLGGIDVPPRSSHVEITGGGGNVGYANLKLMVEPNKYFKIKSETMFSDLSGNADYDYILATSGGVSTDLDRVSIYSGYIYARNLDRNGFVTTFHAISGSLYIPIEQTLTVGIDGRYLLRKYSEKNSYLLPKEDVARGLPPVITENIGDNFVKSHLELQLLVSPSPDLQVGFGLGVQDQYVSSIATYNVPELNESKSSGGLGPYVHYFWSLGW